MFGFYLNIGIIYFIIGFTAALIYYFIFRRKTIGKFWGALLVGVIGSFLGAVIEFLFKDVIEFLANISDSVNIFPPIIVAFFALWVFWTVSNGDTK